MFTPRFTHVTHFCSHRLFTPCTFYSQVSFLEPDALSWTQVAARSAEPEHLPSGPSLSEHVLALGGGSLGGGEEEVEPLHVDAVAMS